MYLNGIIRPAVLATLLAAGTAQAAITVYTNRAAFLAAINPTYLLETFDGLGPGSGFVFPLPFTGNGYGFTASAPPIGFGLIANGFSGDVVLAVNSNADPLTLGAFTGPQAVTAVGGDFFVNAANAGPISPTAPLRVTATNGIDTSVQDLLAPTSFTGFLGFVSDGPALTSVTLLRPTLDPIRAWPAVNNFIVGSAATAQELQEPSTLALLAACAAGATAARRRTRQGH